MTDQTNADLLEQKYLSTVSYIKDYFHISDPITIREPLSAKIVYLVGIILFWPLLAALPFLEELDFSTDTRSTLAWIIAGVGVLLIAKLLTRKVLITPENFVLKVFGIPYRKFPTSEILEIEYESVYTSKGRYTGERIVISFSTGSSFKLYQVNNEYEVTVFVEALKAIIGLDGYLDLIEDGRSPLERARTYFAQVAE